MSEDKLEGLALKVQTALLAIEEVREALEEALEEEDADTSLLDSCALSEEGMGNLACDLGFGVINGVMVPR